MYKSWLWILSRVAPEMTNWHILSLLFCLTKHFLSPFSLFYLYLPPSSAHYNHSVSFSLSRLFWSLCPSVTLQTFVTPLLLSTPQRLFSLSCCLSYFRPSLSHSFTPFSPGKEGQLWPCVSWGVPSDSDQWGVSLSSFSRVTIGPWNASVSVSNPHSPHNAPMSITDRTIWLFGLLGVNKNARPWKDDPV